MRTALPTLLLASALLAVACQTDVPLPFTGTPTNPTPTPTSLPAGRLPGGVRAQPGIGKVTLDWDPVTAASFVLYYTKDTSQTLTRSNYAALGGTRTASVVPPLTVLALPADRASVFLVTAVVGTAESEGLAPIRTRSLPSGWKGLVPSQKRVSYVGSRNSGWLGHGLAAGDVNGDGFDDLLAGSPTNVGTDAGHLFVFLGSSNGILASAAPQDVGFGGGASAEFGFAVTAGHFDSDGYADVAVGAPADAAGGTKQGTVVVLKGGPGGLSTTPFWTVSGTVNGDAFGSALASCELSRDTVDDLVVGSPTNGANQEGEAQLFTSASGVLQTTVSRQWLGSGTSASFGSAMSCLGDVNDGLYSDVGFGAPNQSNGFGAVSWAPGTSAAPGVAMNAVQFYAPSASANAGAALAAAGDVDGDSKADMVFSAPLSAGGKAYWLRGTTAFPQAVGTPFATGATGARLGSALAGLDVNGDGFSDVLVGAAAAQNGSAVDTGAVELHLGGPAGLSTSAAFTAFGPSSGSYFGSALAGFRRGNLDSSGDFAVGAYLQAAGATPQAGAIHVFYGPPTRGADVRPGPPSQSSIGSPVTLAGVTFTDPGWDAAFACDVDWGDMTTPLHLDPCTPATLQAASHSYAAPGTWPVRIRVTNTAYGTSGEALASVVVP